MNKQELKTVLELHKKWLEGKEEGKRANLQGADLQGADLWEADLQEANLQGANLRGADLWEADLQEANLQWANLRGADLQGADLRGADLQGVGLRGANLRGADLQGANLRGANLWEADLDYAMWPLWCGGLHVKTDKHIMAQLAYHFCAQDCDDPEYIKARNAILWFANQFHRADECGLLAPHEEESKDD